MRPHCLCSTLLATALALAVNPAASAAPPDCPPVARADAFSTEHWDWRLTFTPSRLQAYWSVTEGFWPLTREQATIVTAQWRPGGWSEPQTAPFSGEYSDMDPFVSPDGRFLFFSSERPTPDGEPARMDLWMATRTWHGWSEPVHLGPEVNSPGDELYASADVFGNLYFASDREGNWNIYRSKRLPRGGYAPAEKLGPGVNTDARWEFNPEISPDGRTLLFVRLDFPGDPTNEGFGFGDIYVSRLRQGEFTPAQNLGACVNTAADEFHPTVLWERRLLFFARSTGAASDFYYTPLRLPPEPH